MSTLNTIIQLRQGTTAEWDKSIVRLIQGEVGLEYLEDGTVKLKAGAVDEDGQGRLWADLPYIGSGIEAALESLNTATIPAIQKELETKIDSTVLNEYYTKTEINQITGDFGDKTIVQVIDEAVAAASYDDSKVRQLIADETVRAMLAE